MKIPKIRWWLWLLLIISVTILIYFVNLFQVGKSTPPTYLNQVNEPIAFKLPDLSDLRSCTVLPIDTHVEYISPTGIKDGTDYRVRIVPNIQTDENQYADFPLYRNELYGFEFRYDPKDEIIDNPDDNSAVGITTRGSECHEGCGKKISINLRGPESKEEIKNRLMRYLGSFDINNIITENTPGIELVAGAGTTEEVKRGIENQIIPGRCAISETTVNGNTTIEADSTFGGIIGYLETNMIIGDKTITFSNSSIKSPEVRTFRLFDGNINNWKAYQSIEYGFSFKHPEQYPPHPVLSNHLLNLSVYPQATPDRYYDGPVLYILVLDSFTAPPFSSVEEIVVNGNKGKLVIEPDELDPGTDYVDYIFQLPSGKFISFSYSETPYIHQQIFRNIINSLSF